MTADNPLILFLEARDRLSEDERRILQAATLRHRAFAARSDIVQEGDRPTDSLMLLSGFAARYHLLADGRRNISAIHIPGDFVDLHSLLQDRMDHSVGAITDCTVALVAHDFLRGLTETQPHLTRLMWLSTIIDAAMHRRWLMAAGRLSATGRLAHFLCEMFVRLQAVLMVDGQSFRLPINQTVVGDAMGLSLVHVNRTLQELRKRELIRWQGEQVTIIDWAGLSELAEFDGTYLNLNVRPR